MPPALASLKARAFSWVWPEPPSDRDVRTVPLFRRTLPVWLEVVSFIGGHKPVGAELADRFVGSDPVVGRTNQ